MTQTLLPKEGEKNGKQKNLAGNTGGGAGVRDGSDGMRTSFRRRCKNLPQEGKMNKKGFLVLLFAAVFAAGLFAQSAEAIGKVVQQGTTFTTYDVKGKKTTHFSSPNRTLLGWGNDFFVLQSNTTYTTYDAKCREISHVSVGGSAPGTVAADSFTVKVGSSLQKFDRQCKRKNQ